MVTLLSLLQFKSEMIYRESSMAHPGKSSRAIAGSARLYPFIWCPPTLCVSKSSNLEYQDQFFPKTRIDSWSFQTIKDNNSWAVQLVIIIGVFPI